VNCAGTCPRRSSSGDQTNLSLASSGAEAGDVRPRRENAATKPGMVYLGTCPIAGFGWPSVDSRRHSA
jgi:hypothetical protein